MKTNLCNVSVLSEPDLELLSNMDPNSVADITGKDFIEQLKEASGRLGGRRDRDVVLVSWNPHLNTSLNFLMFLVSISFCFTRSFVRLLFKGFG